MKTQEILETRKDEIIEKTLDILGNAIAGNTGMFKANLAFFFEIDENNELTVDYYPFVGNQSHREEVFMVMNNTHIPDPSDLGAEDLEEVRDVDFRAAGYDNYIEQNIDDTIRDLEIEEQINSGEHDF